MKECKKWEGCHGITLQETSAFKKGWRAALEWAKKQTGAHYDYNDEHVLHIRMDFIEKELEED
jgi:hypothetical protein